LNTMVLLYHSFQNAIIIPQFCNTTVLESIELFGDKVFLPQVTFKIEVA
jgi:hypothetical protein